LYDNLLTVGFWTNENIQRPNQLQIESPNQTTQLSQRDAHSQPLFCQPGGLDEKRRLPGIKPA
jgi:hypothetical protein